MPEPEKKKEILQEGMIKKGGVNTQSQTPRPEPPKAQAPKPTTTSSE